MKRVRIATTGTYPEGMASTYRIHCYAKALRQECIPVAVVSSGAQQHYAGKRFGFKGQSEGVPYTVVWNSERSHNKWWNYFKAESSSYVLLLHCLFTLRQYDVLWLYGMGFIPRLLLLPILHLGGKKVILELNEYPYSTEGNKYTRIPAIRKLLQRGTLRWVFPQLDGIVVISERLREVAAHDAPKAAILKVPILLDVLQYTNENNSTESPLAYPYLFHAGTLSEQKDGILAVAQAYINAALQLKKKEKTFYLVITNKASLIWDRIYTLLKEADLHNQLIITGYLSEKELRHWIRHATVLLINKPPSFQNQYNFPTKLGDYLMSGRPVIVAAQGMELNNYLKNGENSCVIPPNDIAAMAEKMIEMTTAPNVANSIGQKGKVLSQAAFDYRVQGERIGEFVRRL